MLKQKLLAGDSTLGSWLQLGDQSTCEIMARAGFDWLVVDREHTTISLEQMGNLIRVITLSGLDALVRISHNNDAEIKKVLDAGATGIVVPMLCTVADAEQAVNSCYYPPRGSRGVGLARAQGYGLEFSEHKERTAVETLVIAQIEHYTAVENLSDILAVDGIDGFFVGPYDLSASLGVPGEFDDPRFIEAMEEIERIRLVSNKFSGRHIVEPDFDLLKKTISDGWGFVAFGSEMLFLSHFLKEAMGQLAGVRSNG